AKGEFHLIAIMILLGRSQYRKERREVHFGNSFQVLFHFFLFVKKLITITHILPFTSATNSKMWTKRFRSDFRKFGERNGSPVIITFSFFINLNRSHIAGDSVVDKNHSSIRSFGNSLSFCSGIDDQKIFKNNFSSSLCHSAQK